MAQLPAYAVDGGLVPASMARRVAYATSNGANGVVAVGDLKVTALPTPAGAVRISRGAALCRQRTSGANEYETYAIAQDSAFDLTVPITGSSARTDYVIARVTDWHFTGGVAPADPENALYWQFALVSTTAGITTPHVVLAKITRAANSTIVQAANITDMREVAIPRTTRTTRLIYVTSAANLTSNLFIDWPAQSSIPLEIPSWAGHAIVRCDLLETLHQTANVDGRMTLMIGSQPSYTGERRYDEVYGGSTQRRDHTIVSEFVIPENFRGTTQPLRIRARRLNGTGSLRADTYTQVVYDIQFIEKV